MRLSADAAHPWLSFACGWTARLPARPWPTPRRARLTGAAGAAAAARSRGGVASADRAPFAAFAASPSPASACSARLAAACCSRIRPSSYSSRSRTRERRVPMSSSWSTSSLAATVKWDMVATRSAKRPGSATFILRTAGTSVGTRSIAAARVSRAVRMRGIRSSRTSSSGTGSSTSSMVATRYPLVSRVDRMRTRRSPCTVACIDPPGRWSRSVTRETTPTFRSSLALMGSSPEP